MAGKIQNADIKSLAELTGLGAAKAQLPNTDKMYTPKSDEVLETTLRKNNYSAVVDPTAYSGMFINYDYSEDIDTRDGGVAIASNY